MTKKLKPVYIVSFAVIVVCFLLVVFLVLALGGVFNAQTRLVFSSGSIEKVYDGTPLSLAEWSLADGKLKDGHTASVTATASRTEAGISANHLSISILNDKGKDVTDGYSIECRTGDLWVKPRQLYIKSGSASKVYDGAVLTCHEYSVESGDTLEGQSLSVDYTGARTDAGVSDNTFIPKITGADSKDVTLNYDITKEFGALEVVKRAISISTPSYQKVYDGKPLALKEWYYASEAKILSKHTIEVDVVGTQTDVGLAANKIGGVRIYDGQNEVTFNYQIVPQEGELVVSRREITVRSFTDQKIYDGEPLINHNYKIESQTVQADGEEMTVIISGTRTPMGISNNTIAQVIIKTATGRDVTFNYSIKAQEGTLTVTDSSGGIGAGSSGSGGSNTALDESGTIGGFGGAGGASGAGEVTVTARVFSDVSDDVYLRYLSFGNFDGQQWEKANDYQGLIDSKYSLNYLTSIALKNNGHLSERISVELYTNNYLLPYYLDTDPLSYKTQTSDVKYEGSEAEYSAYYFLFNYIKGNLNGSLPASLTQLERDYYNYVKSTYLAIPSSAQSYFNTLAGSFDANSPRVIADVANYIQNAAEYSVNYNPALDGEVDVAVSFLQKYKQGICSHFASAAVLLYRALGIPARYTIGYLSYTKAGEWVEVMSTDAHAWPEVYISGLGWVQVEVTPASTDGDGNGSGGNGGSGSKKNLYVKPVDIFVQYTTGAVITAQSNLQGLSSLIAKGYSYRATVTGRQAAIGIGYSTITSFALFDAAGSDVTNQYNITFSSGKLHLYVRQITLLTQNIFKTYDGKPLNGNDYTVEGALIGGHSIKGVELTGKQVNAGSSENSCNITIVDEGGADVTYMYKVNKNFGSLTVLAREITIMAGSKTKAYDGLELTCSEYEITCAEGEPLAEGDKISVFISSSLIEVGRRANEIGGIDITNASGRVVTSNYSVTYLSGLLTVTRP